MKYFIALVCFLMQTSIMIAQENTKTTTIENCEVDYIPFKTVETPPIYPGCTGINNIQLKECFANAISKFMSKNLDLDKPFIPKDDDMSVRFFSRFIINKKGYIQDIKVRAKNTLLEKELIKVIKQLPVMLPGKQKGKEVAVLYSFPIVLDFK